MKRTKGIVVLQFLMGLCAVALPFGSFAQPGNDNPCGAEPLTVNASCVYSTWSNVSATGTAGPPAPTCASYLGGDVWFSVIVPPGGSLTLSTNTVGGSALTDGGMSIYTAASCAGPFTQVSCDDDSGPGLMPQLNYTGPAGSTIWVRFWEYGNNAFGAFNICASAPPPPAANNEPCAATLLTAAAACTNTLGSNVGATASAGIPAPTCSFYTGGDVWFRVTVPAGGTVTLTADVAGGSAIGDMGMAIYTAGSCAGPFTQVGCDDDSGPGLMPMLTYTGAPGTVLYIRMWEYGNDTFGGFNICATIPAPPPPPPTNNEPCTATPVTVSSSCSYATYTNVNATNSAMTPTPTCGFFGAASLDVWFSFVAPASGVTTIQTQAGTMTDGAMALYLGPSPNNCAGPFTLVSCDDDSGPGFMPFMSFTNLIPGRTYYLRVWGFSSSAGSFGLCIFGPSSVPAGQCVYVLRMFDSFGDGWGSSSVGISINGSPFTNYTVTGSYNVVLIGLNAGNVLVVNYTATGPGQAENSYILSFMSNGMTVFNSGSPPVPGIAFTQTVTCTPPPAPPQDCAGGITVCSGQAFGNNSNNTGNVVDLNSSNQGCLTAGERQGTWYYFSPSTSGTIGFTIAPTTPTDYDFALWGPMSTISCPPTGTPLRCSFSALTTNTGLGNAAADASEGAGGDAWVSTINVIAGQLYILYVDNFSSNGQAFNLSWQLTNGASLDCTVLPIELLRFEATTVKQGIELSWATATELDNDRFEVERSADGTDFHLIGVLSGAGTTTQETRYQLLDPAPLEGLNHYRLKQVDVDGTEAYSNVRTAWYRKSGQEIALVPNPGSSWVHVVMPNTMPGSVLLLFDATGQEVMRTPLWRSSARINVTDLPHGLYAVRILSATGEPLAHSTWMRE